MGLVQHLRGYRRSSAETLRFSVRLSPDLAGG